MNSAGFTGNKPHSYWGLELLRGDLSECVDFARADARMCPSWTEGGGMQGDFVVYCASFHFRYCNM